MQKKFGTVIQHLHDVFVEKVGIIFLLSILNYICYGLSRYVFGKYRGVSVITKFLKISSGFINTFLFFTLIFLILSFVNKKIRKAIIWLLSVSSLIFFIFDSFLLYKFKLIIGGTTVQILAETNKQETLEFLKASVSIGNIIVLVILLCIMLLFLKLHINIKSKKILSLIFILSIAQVFMLKGNFKAFPLKRFIDGINVVRYNDKIYKQLANKIDNNSVIITKNSSKIKNIVFIIGESTTRNHMGLYGYSLDTNPLLKKLEEKGNLFKYTDVISPHGQTIPSMKKILTFYNGQSEKEWHEYNNIIDIMKKSGYKTYWFSNQESSGIVGNLPAAFANRSDVVLFNLNRDSAEEVFEAYDKQIVEKSVNEVSGDKNFIIYHLLGTHKGYSYRYPEEFSVFKSEDIKRDNLDDEQRKTVSEYDNAVLYNDYVVKSIIDIYKDSDSIVIYLSDHGEEVYDFRDVADHGEGNISHYMVEIPFIIYVSDKFKENYPELVEKIRNSTSRPYMTDDIIHTILDISGVETKDYNPTRSVVDDKFIQRDRLIHDKSYDNYWKILN